MEAMATLGTPTLVWDLRWSNQEDLQGISYKPLGDPLASFKRLLEVDIGLCKGNAVSAVFWKYSGLGISHGPLKAGP